jgi:hypothetical protein
MPMQDQASAPVPSFPSPTRAVLITQPAGAGEPGDGPGALDRELGLVPACGTDISPWPGWAIPHLWKEGLFKARPTDIRAEDTWQKIRKELAEIKGRLTKYIYM